MRERVLAVEQAYVAAATGAPALAPAAADDDAFACAAAVAARFLAIGTPRTFGVLGATPAQAIACVAAHATWFTPRELRCNDAAVAAALAGDAAEVRVVDPAGVLACDLVCVFSGTVPGAALRGGTHLSLAPGVTVDDAARMRLEWSDEGRLAELAAGLVDGRQLDEITAFAAGDLAVARAALTRVSAT